MSQICAVINELTGVTVQPGSTIGDLPVFDRRVPHTMTVSELSHLMNHEPNTFAVMLMRGDRCTGIISRDCFAEHMSRPYVPELYARHHVQVFAIEKGFPVLRLPADTPIGDAGQRALARPRQHRHEPVLVEHPDRPPTLLDFDTLLAAMAHLLQLEIHSHRETVDELRCAEAELTRLTRTDALTGLYNRRHLDETLRNAYEHARRSETSIAVVMLDIDFFKLYNDCFGHHGGDLCLKKIAAAIDDASHRPTDISARYGGEEFTVVLPHTPIGGAVQVAERIAQNVANMQIPHPRSPVSPSVTLSIGVAAETPGVEGGVTDLVQRADKNLYEAKRLGRNRVVAEHAGTVA